VNPATRRIALFAIAAIAIAASANALAHSYAGLYAWALHHRLTGWQAVSWPAEIDVFLAVGELALYVAYLDGWPGRQRVWPWATTLVGLAVSVAGNVGHIQPLPGHPVLLADRFTAAASPLAAFAGLTVGLLVLRMNRQQASAHPDPSATDHRRLLPAVAGHGNGLQPVLTSWSPGPVAVANHDQAQHPEASDVSDGRVNGLAVSDESALLKDAALICNTAAARGERLTQRALARTLRGRGHRFPNQSLHTIALAVGLSHSPGQLPADGGQLP
jgi:hypothetical protein